jgi:Flp pilus assembly protein protease CpaA
MLSKPLLLLHPAVPGLLTLWLLPCALQDYRRRRISNWLTVPLFLAAWPVALVADRFVFTGAVFLGFYAAWKLRAGMGAADGKIAVGMAAIAPWGFLLSLAIQLLGFLYCRLRGRPEQSMPGAVFFYLGGVVLTSILAAGWLVG